MMTKCTCSCGATIETDSTERLRAWASDHSMCRALHSLPQWPTLPNPIAPSDPGPGWPYFEITCGPDGYPDIRTWIGETAPSPDALAAVMKSGGWRQ